MTHLELSQIKSELVQVEKDYYWSQEQLRNLDDLTQDYLHDIELNKLNYEERAKVATKIASVRKERRVHKNNVEMLEPMVDILKTHESTIFLKKIEKVIGRMRTIEELQSKRTYRKKCEK